MKQKPDGIPKGHLRRDDEPPDAIARYGWRYHHIGVPTQTPRAGEVHVPHLHIHVKGFQTSPFGVQWMRFGPDAPYPEEIKTLPHVAFEVDDLATALMGREVLIAPNSPCTGLTVAMILDDGVPVELMEFSSKRRFAGTERSIAELAMPEAADVAVEPPRRRKPRQKRVPR